MTATLKRRHLAARSYGAMSPLGPMVIRGWRSGRTPGIIEELATRRHAGSTPRALRLHPPASRCAHAHQQRLHSGRGPYTVIMPAALSRPYLYRFFNDDTYRREPPTGRRIGTSFRQRRREIPTFPTDPQ